MGHHVGFQKCAFEQNVVVIQGFVDRSQDSFCFGLANCYAMASIRENLWFYNRNKAILLADECVASKPICILMNPLRQRQVEIFGQLQLQNVSVGHDSSSSAIVFLMTSCKVSQNTSHLQS